MKKYIVDSTDVIEVSDDCVLLKFVGVHWIADLPGQRTVYAAVQDPRTRTSEEMIEAGLDPAWAGVVEEWRMFGEIRQIFATNGRWYTVRWNEEQVSSFPLDLRGVRARTLP